MSCGKIEARPVKEDIKHNFTLPLIKIRSHSSLSAISRIPVHCNRSQLSSLSNSSSPKCVQSPHSCAVFSPIYPCAVLPDLPAHIHALHKIHNLSNHQHNVHRSVTHQHLFDLKKPLLSSPPMPSTSSTSSRGATPINRNRSDSSATQASHARKKQFYAEYMPLCEMQKGLAKGQIVEGVLRINPKNYNDAYISAPDGGLDIFVKGFADRNRALNGDLVAVELFEQSKWTISYSAINANYDKWRKHFQDLLQRKQSNATADLSKLSLNSQDSNKLKMTGTGCQDSLLESLKKEFALLPEKIYDLTIADLQELPFCHDFIQRTGKVVCIREMNHTRVAGGTIKVTKGSNAELVSTDLRVPRVLIARDSLPAHFLNNYEQLKTNLFLVKITKWSLTSLYPFGEILKELGDPSDINNENELLLTTNGVDTSEFGESALEEYKHFMTDWKIPQSEIQKRSDIRGDCVFTIDPQSARDLDDAISIGLNADQSIEVGVHIADVSYFIVEGTQLDKIAQKRATSVYLPNRVIPMLPHLFCQNLCSLNAGEDKLSFSVFFTLDANTNEIRQLRFERTIMNSCAKLSYEHAQKMIDTPIQDLKQEEFPQIFGNWSIQDIAYRVKSLHIVSQRLRKQRYEQGSMRIEKTKLSFFLDSEGLPLGFTNHVLKDSNFLIEELMLLANRSVAKRIYDVYGATGQIFLRNHVEPSKSNVNDLMSFCKSINIEFDVSSSLAMHKSLQSVKNINPVHYKLLSLCLVKCMKLATYVQGSNKDPVQLFHHYALNFDFYTHFTSPIRRYADLVVHRLLAASLPKYRSKVAVSPTSLKQVANHCNARKYAAMLVSEGSGLIYLRAYISRLTTLEVDTVVIAVFDNSFDVLILDFDLTKRVYLDHFPLEQHCFSKQNGMARLRLTWKAVDKDNRPNSLVQEITSLTSLRAQLSIYDDNKIKILIAHPNGDYVDARAQA